MTVYPIQASFSRGEFSPLLDARVDLEFYKTALKTATNWTILRTGGLRRRPGFKFVRSVKTPGKTVRLMPFIFSTEQSYCLEVGEGYIRKFVNGGVITSGGGAPTSISKANPAAVNHPAHGFSSGRVLIQNLGGMTELNNRELVATVVDPNNYTLNVDSTGYSTYTGGGTITKIVETATAFDEEDLEGVDYAQTADVVTLVHGLHKPQELSRTSDTVWAIEDIEFKDGPYLDPPKDNANGCQADIRSCISEDASVISDPNLFDTDTSTFVAYNATSWTVTLEFAAPVVCDNYAIHSGQADSQPISWTVDGWDGSGWITLDMKSGDVGVSGERRFYTFRNATAFSKYRLAMTTNAGRESTSPSGVPIYALVEVVMGYNGDYAPTMTLGFDNTTDINAGDGFNSGDVGRHIRLFGTDAKWRWFVIDTVNSTTQVEGRLYGYALPNLSKIFNWQLGAWRADNYPQKVSFYKARRVFARSDLEPQAVWLSKTFDFYDMGTSQPLVDDDGMRLRAPASRAQAIAWITELERMAIGTSDSVRVLGKDNQNARFGATNFELMPQVFSGAKNIKPAQVGSVVLFADYHGKTIRELVYELAQEGYIAPDVSILSEHFFTSGIKEMAFQSVPDSTVWIVTEDGSLIMFTYEREQKIVGFTRCEIGEGDPGTGTFVESVASIPGNGRDEVWILVRRTIDGSTKRYIEVLADEFRGGDVEDAVFLDSAVTYSGTATNSVTGVNHLLNCTVDVLADGIVHRGLTVSSGGTVTLPNSLTASKWTIGLRYRSTGTTLAVSEAGQKDGVHLGRRKLNNDVRVSVFESLGLKVQGINSARAFDVFNRLPSDPVGEQMALRTGIYRINFDNSWRDDGQFTFYSEDPLPCTIRAFILSVSGEP